MILTQAVPDSKRNEEIRSLLKWTLINVVLLVYILVIMAMFWKKSFEESCVYRLSWFIILSADFRCIIQKRILPILKWARAGTHHVSLKTRCQQLWCKSMRYYFTCMCWKHPAASVLLPPGT
jgi:hypothetical protein